MVEVLDAADVEADVVAGPELAELVAAGRELADEVGEITVVGVAAGGRAQGGDDVAGDAVPVEVELVGARVEEDEAGGVGAFLAVREGSVTCGRVLTQLARPPLLNSTTGQRTL